MSFPTVLSPWYVVWQPAVESVGGLATEAQYYEQRAADDPEGLLFSVSGWTKNPREAMLFMSLHSAARVAHAEGAQVRVLTTKEEADEFRQKENVSDGS